MLSYIWPIGLVVLSNVLYQICAKSIPSGINPFASLTITYVVAAIISLVLYHVTNKEGRLLEAYAQMNWAPFVLGIVIIGLEVGFIYAYKAGWQVSTASIVQSSFLAVVLLIVGFLLYHEALTARKVIGMLICLVGLYFINK